MEFFKIKEEQVEDLTEDSDGGEKNEIKSERIPAPSNTTTNVMFTSDEPFDQKYTLELKEEHGEESIDTLQMLHSRLSNRNVDKSLNQAIEEIRKGGSLSAIASYYKLSEDLIYNTLVSRNVTHEMDILTKHEEISLVKWILRSNKNNSLVMKRNLLERVGKMKKVLRITPIFARSKFGRMWYKYFLKSYPEIVEDDGVLFPSDEPKLLKEDPGDLVSLYGLKQAVVILNDFRKQKNFLSTLDNKVSLPAYLRAECFNVKIKSEEPKECFPKDDCFDGFEMDSPPDIAEVKNSLSDCETSTRETSDSATSPEYNNKNISNLVKSISKKRFKTTTVDFKPKCEKCQKSFCNKAKLQRHLFTHIPKELYTVSCYKCFKRFPSKYHFLVHLRITHSDLNHTCSVCGKVYKHQTSLTNHFRREHRSGGKFDNPRRFICDICNKHFKYKNSLEAHIMYYHLKEKKQHSCNYCNKKFIKHSALIRHKTSHTKIRPMPCPHCRKSFSRKYLLMNHMEKCEKPERVDILDEECQKLCQEFMDEILLD